MIGMIPSKKDVQEINTLLAVVSDPKATKKALDEISTRMEALQAVLKESNEAKKSADKRLKELAEEDRKFQSQKAQLQTWQSGLQDLENEVKIKKEDLDKRSNNFTEKTTEMGKVLQGREDSVTNRERAIAQLQANADKTMSDAQELKRTYEGKLNNLKKLAG